MIARELPQAGCYYINLTGQLIKVKALLYTGEHLTRLALEYLDGKTVFISIQEWDWLDFVSYSEWLGEIGDDREAEYDQ